MQLQNITFAYKNAHVALKDLSASYEAGIHLLLGPNGAGKTTLFKVMAGLLRPQLGDCMIGKESAAWHDPHTVREIFMLADNMVFPLDSINQMAKLHAPFYSNFSAEFLASALKAFGLNGDERLADLSLGNRHKAQLAYALSLGTKYLLLDEPSNGLDIASKRVLSGLISQAFDLDTERCVIIATHTVQEMRNLYDSVTILNHGEIVLNASTERIVERLAFVSGPQRDDAIFYQPSIDGPTQIVPSHGEIETPIDYILLYTTAVGPKSDALRSILS